MPGGGGLGNGEPLDRRERWERSDAAAANTSQIVGNHHKFDFDSTRHGSDVEAADRTSIVGVASGVPVPVAARRSECRSPGSIRCRRMEGRRDRPGAAGPPASTRRGSRRRAASSRGRRGRRRFECRHPGEVDRCRPVPRVRPAPAAPASTLGEESTSAGGVAERSREPANRFGESIRPWRRVEPDVRRRPFRRWNDRRFSRPGGGRPPEAWGIDGRSCLG